MIFSDRGGGKFVKKTEREIAPAWLALEEERIKTLVSPKVYQRGEEYYEGGHVTQPTLEGQVLRATVTGAEAYDTQVMTNPSGQLSSFCTCPFVREPFCKHAIAVLLQWVRRPESFTQGGQGE